MQSGQRFQQYRLAGARAARDADDFARQDIEIDGVTQNASTAFLRLTMPFNLAGLPAASLPCGFTTDGLPVGLQIAGKPFEEATVLRIAHAYQQLTDWHRREPGTV